jgi:hypothetical protein
MEQTASDDHAGTDTCAGGHEQHIFSSLTGAVAVFSESGKVRIVREGDPETK